MDSKLNINIKYNKMKKISIVTLLCSAAIFAQVGVGTNTPNASAMLDVTSTSKGFLQPRVALTGTSDASTIASPAAGLMIYNTATAGSGATAVTPGVYYYSGSAWQRVTNQAELAAATATTTTFVNGNLGTPFMGGAQWIAPGSTSSKTCNATITLPPGKWEVKMNITCKMTQYDSNWGPLNLSMSYWLQDSNTPDPLNYSQPCNPTLITSDVLFSGAGMITKPIAGTGSLGSEHEGSFFINNTSSGNKTYYLFFHESGIADTENFNGSEPFYAQLGGTTWKSNRFYATKIN